MGYLDVDREDEVLRHLFAVARGKVPKDDDEEKAPARKLRIRLMGQIHDFNKGSYSGWPGLSGTMEVSTLDEARDLRKSVRLFFELLRKQGPSAIYAAMKKLDKE